MKRGLQCSHVRAFTLNIFKTGFNFLKLNILSFAVEYHPMVVMLAYITNIIEKASCFNVADNLTIKYRYSYIIPVLFKLYTAQTDINVRYLRTSTFKEMERLR